MVLSRGADERAQMHAMSMLINTCEGMTDRAHRHVRQLDTAGERARTAGQNGLCESSLQHAGGDDLWS